MTSVIHQAVDAGVGCVGASRENRTPEEPAAALRAIQSLLGIAPKGAEVLPAKKAEAAAAPQAGLQLGEMVRLPAENLYRLVRSTGQILTESMQQASVSLELDSLDGQIAEMAVG